MQNNNRDKRTRRSCGSVTKIRTRLRVTAARKLLRRGKKSPFEGNIAFAHTLRLAQFCTLSRLASPRSTSTERLGGTRGRTRSVDVCSATLDNALNRPRITLRTIDRSLFNKRNRDYTHVLIRSARNKRRLQSFPKMFKYVISVGYIYMYIKSYDFRKLKIVL